MKEKKVLICRLCLNIVSDNNFEFVNETRIIQTQYILPDTELSITDNPALCTPCTDALQESYEFKTACIELETYLQDFISPLSKIDLKEVVTNKFLLGDTKKEIMEIEEDNKICRLCLGQISDKSFKEFGVIEENILQKCIPEMDLTFTDDPVSCENCMGYLHNHFNFVMRCLEVEETINAYLISKNLNLSSCNNLNLHEVVQLSIQNNQITEVVNNCQSSVIKVDDKNQVFTGEISSESVMVKPFYDEVKCLIEKQSNEDFVKNEYVPESSISQPAIWHRCELCSYATVRKYSLHMHMLIHKKPEELTIHKCTICSHETNRKSNLLIHLLKHKEPEEVKMHQCKECTYETRLRSNLLKHQLVHKKPEELKMHQCPNCSYQSKLKGNLLIHMIQHKSPDELVMHKCKECSYQTKLKNNLKKHILTHQGPQENAPVYKCKECSYQSRWKSHLLRHMVLHNSVEVNYYKCEHCSYVANHKDNLRKHQLTHKDPSEIIMHKCELCDFQNKRKYKIRQHMYKMHKCSTCDLVTKDKIALIEHLKTHDLSQQSFKCNICSYEATQKRYLQRHRKTHLVENPDQIVWHKCELCPYQAKRKDVLHNHMLVHKDPSQVEMYKCPTCPYQTKRKYNLVIHQKSHCKGDPLRKADSSE